MPCVSIHLAVAKKYLENHPEENTTDFVMGSIAADFSEDEISVKDYITLTSDDKNARHFGLTNQANNIIDYMKKKVDLGLFLKNNEINNSFMRAYFLHLLCDYYFFGDYIYDDKLSKYPLKDAVMMGYNDYSLITPILIEKYNLDVPEVARKYTDLKGTGEISFLKVDLVDKFISDMASLDLEEEKEKYINTNTIK